MLNEIVYVCNSINNKNVRAGELNILRKFEEGLYFEFGESESNIKKRFYRNIEVLNSDFEAIQKIKEKLENEAETVEEEVVEEVIEEPTEEIIEEEPEEEKVERPKRGRPSKSYYKRSDRW